MPGAPSCAVKTEEGPSEESSLCIELCKKASEMPDDPKVQEEACGAIRKLAMCRNESHANIALLAKNGACEVVCKAVKTFENNNPKVRNLAFLAISALSHGSVATRNLLSKNGACEVICKMMRRFPNSPIVQRCCCRSINNFTQVDGANRELLIRNGARELVCSAARKFQDNVKNLREACISIGRLSCWATIFDRELLGKNGACKVLCDAAKLFPNDAEFQKIVCSSMAYLAFDCTPNRVLLGKGGACEIACSAARAFRDHPALQHSACWLIGNLSFSEASNAEILAKHGACSVVCSAAKAFPDSHEIQTMACKAIINLIHSSPANKYLLIKEGVCDILRKASTNNRLDQDMVRSAIRSISLGATADNPAVKRQKRSWSEEMPRMLLEKWYRDKDERAMKAFRAIQKDDPTVRLLIEAIPEHMEAAVAMDRFMEALSRIE